MNLRVVLLSCAGDVHPHALAILSVGTKPKTPTAFQEGWVAEIGVGTGILTSALLRRPGCLGVVGFEMDEEILKQGASAAAEASAGRRKLTPSNPLQTSSEVVPQDTSLSIHQANGQQACQSLLLF